MTQWLKQSTATTVKMGPFVDSGDGTTAETGLTIQKADVRLSKNGGNYAAANADQGTSDAGAAHDELGDYDISLDATDTNTLGRLRVIIKESGALAVWADFMVVPANVWDSLFGADKLQVDVTQVEGSDATSEIASAVWDEDATGHQTAGSFGAAVGDPADHEDASILSWVDDMYANVSDIETAIGTPAGVSIAADVAALPTAAENATELLDQAAGVETNRTLRQSLRLMLAALAGKASGMATTTATFRDTNDSKDRIVATVDSDGNRTAITLDAS